VSNVVVVEVTTLCRLIDDVWPSVLMHLPLFLPYHHISC